MNLIKYFNYLEELQLEVVVVPQELGWGLTQADYKEEFRLGYPRVVFLVARQAVFLAHHFYL